MAELIELKIAELQSINGDLTRAVCKLKAENAKFRVLLKLAETDMAAITAKVAFEGIVCGSECAHFWFCEKVKNNDSGIYRCQNFKWRYADAVEEMLKSENT